MGHLFPALAIFIGMFSISLQIEARTEFALKYGINRCTACHLSPAGGGPRNLQGKYFGGNGFKTETWAQTQDFLGTDAKFLYHRASDSKQARGGMGVMYGSLWGNLMVRGKTPEQAEIRLLAEQNLGGFGSGPRQWYLRWKRFDDTETGWVPQYFLIGRHIPAFGLMTDEHRNYVRLQSGTSWNTGMDTGFLLSSNPTDSFHYDLSILNGQKNTGTALAPEMADIWGTVANVRLLPSGSSWLLGVSHSYYPRTSLVDQALASSLYFQLSLHRLSDFNLPMTISSEYVEAENWNSSFAPIFVSDASYSAAIQNSRSQGLNASIEWDFSSRFVGIYRYDQLRLNRDFPSDAYVRHSLGLKHAFANNAWAVLRYEKAAVGQPSEENGIKTGAQDAFWMLLSLSI